MPGGWSDITDVPADVLDYAKKYILNRVNFHVDYKEVVSASR